MVSSPEDSALGALYKANFGSHFFSNFKNIIQHSKTPDQKEAILFESERSDGRFLEGPTLGGTTSALQGP